MSFKKHTVKINCHPDEPVYFDIGVSGKANGTCEEVGHFRVQVFDHLHGSINEQQRVIIPCRTAGMS